MTSSLRERRQQRLRDEILEAARELLAEKGYAATSMDELAARVGVSKPTLYSHFPEGKDSVVAAAATTLMERFLDVMLLGPGERSPLEQLTFLLHTFVQMQVESGALTAQLWMPEILQVLRKHSDSFACMQRIDAAVVELAQQAQAQGELAPHLDAPTVVRAFHALAQAPHIAPLSSSGTPNPATIASTLANIFRSGVQS